MSRRRWYWLALVPVLGLINVLVGAIVPPTGPGRGPMALARLTLALACSVSLVIGPGLALRARQQVRGGRPFPLALVGLMGPTLLAATGGLSWWAAKWVSPRAASAFLLVPVLLWLLTWARRCPLSAAVDDGARLAVLVTLVVLLVAVAKGTWSPGPAGELYGDTISRTLEVGARSDSRIPYHVVQLVAHGTGPYSDLGRSYFAPWSFSDRGPLAGLAASPVVLLSGAAVPAAMPGQPWSPFDQQGFAAYRIAMSTMAVTSLMSLFALALRARGARVALDATLLAALTPFLVHEMYFTWPKMFATAVVLSATALLLEGRPGWAGVLIGIAYLVHPMALFSAPPLALLWLVIDGRPEHERRLTRSLRSLATMGAAVGLSLLLWRCLNGDNFHQGGFVAYFLNADGRPATGIGDWLSSRWTSVLNTLVPFHVVVADGEHRALNSVSGPSPATVRFYLQYWTSLPFAVGIIALPAFVGGLFRSARRWPLLFGITVLFPFVLFTVFWGADRTGLLREGLHVWVVTLVVLVALSRSLVSTGTAPRGALANAVWVVRAFEVFLMLLVPAVVTGAGLYRRTFLVSDVVALVVIVAGLAWLGWQTLVCLRPWTLPVPSEQPAMAS